MSTEPIDWQERHSPTSEELIHETDGRRTTRQYVRVRVSQHRLMQWMDSLQVARAQALFAGWEILTRGLGVRVNSFEQRSPSPRITTGEGRCVADDYLDWVKACKKAGITAQQMQAASIVLFENGSQTEAARAVKKRVAWVKHAITSVLSDDVAQHIDFWTE